jgi:hypothetical protein
VVSNEKHGPMRGQAGILAHNIVWLLTLSRSATNAFATTVALASSNKATTPRDTKGQVGHWPDSYFLHEHRW